MIEKAISWRASRRWERDARLLFGEISRHWAIVVYLARRVGQGCAMSNSSLLLDEQKVIRPNKLQGVLKPIFFRPLYWFRTPLRLLYKKLPRRFRYHIRLLLAYEYQARKIDGRIITLLKWLGNGFLLYFPLFFCLRVVQRVFSDKVYYPSEKEITLTTTWIIFTHSQRVTWEKICLKVLASD